MSELPVVTGFGADEAEQWTRVFMTGLLQDPKSEPIRNRLRRWQLEWEPERVWGVRDPKRAGGWVATLATEARQLTVPAGLTGTQSIDVDALTAVTVEATHRRRGLLGAMMAESLAAAHARGDAVSILVAAEWPIYGRYGYAPATQNANYTLRARSPMALLAPPTPDSVRTVDAAELAAIAPLVHNAAGQLRPGDVDRAGSWWPRYVAAGDWEQVHEPRNWIVHEGADGPDGLLGWRATRDFELYGALGAASVGDFFAATADAYRDLWAYLCGIDVIDEITLADRPVDEPIRWLLRDGRALRKTAEFDMLWVRLLDVPAALAARGYAVADRVVLDVVDDDLGGYGTGRVLLDTSGAQPMCTVSDEPAQLRINQRLLASIYLGGHRLAQAAAGGGVQELSAGALDRVDTMFATSVPPWSPTYF